MTRQISKTKMFEGMQYIYEHPSTACDCDMRVAVYVPPQAENGTPCPTLIWLSGLTCTEDNFTTKAGAQRMASKLGLILVAPDTSPRGDDVPDVDAYDFGKGAGFYLNATQDPWAKNYQMETYIRDELTAWVKQDPMCDPNRIGIFGHSMGGHGALTLHLKNPGLFKTCSAFAPIVTPSDVPWGQKAFEGYLGEDKSSWGPYDANKLVQSQPSPAHILIDQGTNDPFYPEQLEPEKFVASAQQAGQEISLRLQDGYDHSYYFIATFIDDHLQHHAKYLEQV
ncbi:MAG TPA: S-formylglutathione hydrolase [Hellea balneolensis]|uniref:S-formylglutathione hydrolase n=1 Tax=Hellea balneolensis TaxID=287478 RepID=A0A7C3GD65_9PROT|nr:S-formylglutathione hydrolase [Hellea balneolensis]